MYETCEQQMRRGVRSTKIAQKLRCSCTINDSVWMSYVDTNNRPVDRITTTNTSPSGVTTANTRAGSVKRRENRGEGR